MEEALDDIQGVDQIYASSFVYLFFLFYKVSMPSHFFALSLFTAALLNKSK